MKSLSCGSALGVLMALTGTLTLGADAGPQKRGKGEPARIAVADRLTREAQTAELAGDNARRGELLAQALKEDPNCLAARWQSGFVSVDGKWLTIADAVQKFSSDRNLAEYRRRRASLAAGGNFVRGPVHTSESITGRGESSVSVDRTDALSSVGVSANADLARWCQAKRLFDQERAHWVQVLREVPKDHEAQSRLGVRWFRGGLHTIAEINAIESQWAADKKDLAEWKSVVSKWKKFVDFGSPEERIQAATEMSSVSDATVLPALEQVLHNEITSESSRDTHLSGFARCALEMMGRLRAPRAIRELVLESVLAPGSDVRALAVAQLRQLPLDDFVPQLLEGLRNPIEFQYTIDVDPSFGVVTNWSLAEERSDAITVRRFSSSADSRPERSVQPLAAMRQPKAIEAAAAAAMSDGRKRAETVASMNAQQELLSKRINQIMERIAKDLNPSDPAAPDTSEVIPASSAATPHLSIADRWWGWWADYNESYVPPKRTEVIAISNGSGAFRDPSIRTYSESSIISNVCISRLIPAYHSCFTAGTAVQTETGCTPIESLSIGDRVLSQDVDSGELTFKPVLGTTVRPPVATMAVRIGHDTLRTTRGHPFWVVGKGWRMAKELAVGDMVHTLGGSARVDSIESRDTATAYNLVVADFGTYFVGDGSILVHDTMQRLPTPAVLPGYLKAEK